YLHPHKLSQMDKEHIVAALQSGKTPTELSVTYGVSSSHIGQIFKKATGKLLPRRSKITQSDRETIAAAIQSGKTTKELAAQFGVSSGHIGHVYKQVTGRVSLPGKKRSQRLSQRDKEAIIAELQAGKATQTELAGKYNI